MGFERGFLKGVCPLHGVTGATRRREGAWPPSGSPEPLRATSNAHPLRQPYTRVETLNCHISSIKKTTKQIFQSKPKC